MISYLRMESQCIALKSRVIACITVKDLKRDALFSKTLGNGQPSKTRADNEHVHNSKENLE